MSARRVAVAASGGRDSSALLHCTARLAARAGVQVVALHVHHGLMAAADQWLEQVRQQSRRWGVLFMAHRVQEGPQAGDSVEAWARLVRYKALAAMAHKADCTTVLLAHHRRDQAETWLLQALRGAGPAGQSAMPGQARRDDLTWCRPWLDQPRSAIEAYVTRHRLRFVDDDSNTDARFMRNRLRLQVMPSLLVAFPDAEQALAAAAGHAQAARALADEVARADLPALLTADQALNASAWLQLTPARRGNALRAWLLLSLDRGAPETLVQRLLAEVPASLRSASKRSAMWPCPGGALTLYRGLLSLQAQAQAQAQTQTPAVALPSRAPAAMVMDLSRVGCHAVAAWHGAFEVRPARVGGLSVSALRVVTLRARQGGERISLVAGAPERSLKKQYQYAGVPQSGRSGPLVWAPEGQLLFVPGLGVPASALARKGQAQRCLRWLPDAGN